MTLIGYLMPNSVFVPAVLDSEGLTFKDNCVKSNKHRPILSAAKIHGEWCKPIVCSSWVVMLGPVFVH